MYVYGAYQFEFTLVDSWGHGKKCNTLFYAIDQKGPDIVIGMPGLKNMKVLIDPEAEQWRFKVDTGRLQVEEPIPFGHNLQKEPNVYAIMCAAVAPGAHSEGNLEVPRELLGFADTFFKRKCGYLACF